MIIFTGHMDQLLTHPLFQGIFNTPVPRIIVIADAPKFTIVTSNDAHKAVTNLIGRDISGKSVWEIFDPNEAGGDGAILLENALTESQLTNKTVLMPPFRYDMGSPDGKKMVEKWWQLEIMPVGGDGSTPDYLLTTTNEITEQVLREKEKERVQQELENLLAVRTSGLVSSEKKYRGLVEQSPIAIALLIGNELVIDAANHQMLRIWDSTEWQESEPGNLQELIGKKLTEAFPDIDTRLLEILYIVFSTGTSNHFETTYSLGPDIGRDESYARVLLSPVFNEEGEVSAIILSAMDVTEQVRSRKEMEHAYEQLKLSKLAAQMGTFDLDLKAGTMEWDERCRELFGISHHDEVTYENDFLKGLHPDDRDRIQAVISELFDNKISNGNYDVEYRTISSHDKKVRWVRAKGKVYFDSDDIAVRFIGSVLDITDQKYEQQLRNDFIAMASHELKTPLTSLLAYIQVLERQAKKNLEKPGLLQQAAKQAHKMVKMINGFLNLSRLESGKLQLNYTEVHMLSLIEGVVSETKLTQQDAMMHISVAPSILVYADREKLEHVLVNLLTNAIKYSNPGQPITINCYADSSQMTLSVSDTGIGIDKRDHDRLFDRFYRIEKPDTKYVAGFGIGLYLSQEIVLLHKGKIWVESEPNKGSTFSFCIPLTPHESQQSV
jgi:two-component system sensor histidine kinase VicK